MINELLTEKKENNDKIQNLKEQKDKYVYELSQTQDKIQKLNKEIEFMNKKFMRLSHSERFSPEKSKRDKELRLASMQVQVPY